MRIGLVTGKLTAEAGGGYTFEREVLESLVALAPETDHRFLLLGLDGAPPDVGLETLEVPRIPGKRLSSPEYEAHLLAQLAQAEVDCLWYLTPLFRATMALPYLCTVWDLQHRLQPFFPEVSAEGEWERREALYTQWMQRATYVIVGTEVGREEVRNFYRVDDRRIAVLPHPTPGFALAPSAHPPSGVRQAHGLEGNYLLYPAQFWPHKNHANLVLALKLLVEREGRDLTLALVGSDQGNRSHVQELARQLGLEPRVRVLGFVSREELVDLYRGALALSYVTHFGPENLPPLEAFALGCPVVASDVPGAAEQLGDAAIRVAPCSPEQIAAAIDRLYTESGLRETLIERGRERAARWTGKEFVRGVFGLLDRFEPIRRCWGR